MRGRSLLRIVVCLSLLAPASGCLCLNGPLFPRLRSLIARNDPPCCEEIVYDAEGPVLEVSESFDVPAHAAPLPQEETMPQPRLVPQPLTTPEAQPMPYAPPKD